MIAIQVLEDRFSEKENKGTQSAGQPGSDGYNHVRRPTRGIVLKDETFATLRVVKGNGEAQPLIDAGSNRKVGDQPIEINGKRATDVYSNFFLQQVNEERMEKQQILETFGEPYIFLFGERARLITFSGILVNTWDFNWEAEWWHNYEEFLRGTRCVENDARVFLSFDETLVSGYIVGASAAKNSQERNFVNFQFQMFLTSYTNFNQGRLGNPYAHPSGIAMDQSLTHEVEVANRPALLDEVGDMIREYRISGGGSLDMSGMSLLTSVKAGIADVMGAFAAVQGNVSSMSSKVSNVLNGQVIRVPVGYAGSLVFDDDVSYKDLTIVTDIGEERAIKYSTFSDNIDEFVGQSSHYGSATLNDRVVDVKLGSYNPLRNAINDGKKATDAAKKIWEAAGYNFTMDTVANTLADAVDIGRSAFQLGSGLYAVNSEAERVIRNSSVEFSPTKGFVLEVSDGANRRAGSGENEAEE